ncbi:hypothetical protein [Kitasatospora sp. NPDC057198]|uniref:hypothetical protein n=1 Tax=Kitasatospora sp. NPDC057198 TaxID=3346046 RepID=UPI0036264665
MPNTDVTALLAELDALPHRDREARFARAVRGAHAGAPDATGALVDELVDELAARGWYGRRLAAFAAALTGRAEPLGAWLTDPDRVVRGRAIAALRTVPGLAAAVPDAYARAPYAVRKELRRALLHGRHAELAARVLPVARELGGDAEVAALLPACPPEVVAAELPGLAVLEGDWYELSARHPDTVLDHLERELASGATEATEATGTAGTAGAAETAGAAGTTGPSADRWDEFTVPLVSVLPLRPARLLDLLEHYPDRSLPSWVHDGFGHLLAVDAERAAALLAAPERPVRRWSRAPSRTALCRLVRRDPPSLPVLGRRWLPHPELFAPLLRAVPPSRRAAFLDAVTEGRPLEGDWLTGEVLWLLPHERRHREARRLLGERAAAGLTEGRLVSVTAMLPPAEARAALLERTGLPQAAERAEAWRQLVRAAAADPDPRAPAGLLADLGRVRNEQDPVRQAALAALAEFPAARFTDADAGVLTALAAAALGARDGSPATRAALAALALSVLSAHPADAEPDCEQKELPAFALRTVERLAAHDDGYPLPPFGGRLRRGQERHLLEALRPQLDAEAGQGRHRTLFALVRALSGQAATRLPELDERLGRAALESLAPDAREGADTTALALWLLPRPGRTRKVLAVLARDPSAVFFPPVQEHLAEARTDLLDALLAQQPPTGRFLRPGAARPLPPARRPDRWAPYQVERAAELLAQALADGSRGPERRRALLQAARLPGTGAAVPRRRLDDPDPLVAAAALTALPRTSDPAAVLPELLAHAGGDRAKDAVYAAGRAARYTEPEQLAPLLAELAVRTTGAKVTSRKEAVRLAAALLPPARAAEVLTAAFRAPGQHPDVRAAVTACAPHLLGGEAGWALLAEAAAAPEPQLRLAVTGQFPARMPQRHRARYALLVAGVAARPGPDGESARAAVTSLSYWARYAPEAAGVLPGLVADPGNRTTWGTAARVLCELAVSEAAHPVGGAAPGSLLHRALAALLAAGPDDPRPARPRDLPLRQRIEVLTMLPAYAPRSREVRLELAELLRPHEELLDVRAALLARMASPTGPGFGAGFARLADALAEHPLLSTGTLGELTGIMAGAGQVPMAVNTTAPDALLALLPGRGPVLGLLAVALTEALGTRCVWTGRWLTLLVALREHPDAEVRSAAGAVTVVPE